MAAKVVRKRRVFEGCANPLFVKWVEELKDEAVEKNAKSQYAYSKALSSLRRYPLPLSSGQEAKLLDHIGEKVAKILDKKLAQYRKRGGDVDECEVSEQLGSPGRGKKKRKKEGSSSKEDVCSGPGSSEILTPKSKRQKSSGPREYVPVYRSGPYALLIALYEAEQKPSWHGYLLKAELIAEAQVHSDSSFTVKEAGSYYTAWSSMTTLVERGFIVRYSHPPKFKLSEKGVSLAVRLLQGGVSDFSQSQGSAASQTNQRPTTAHNSAAGTGGRLSESTQKKKREKKGKEQLPVPKESSPLTKEKCVHSPPSTFCVPDYSPSSSTHSEDHLPPIMTPYQPPSHSVQSKKLEFWYVSPEGRHVTSKDQAAVAFNELSVGFLVKCKHKDLEESFFNYTIDKLRPPDGEYVFAYFSNEQGPDYSNPPSIHGHTPNPRPSHPTTKISETPLSSRNVSKIVTPATKSKKDDAPVIITLSECDPEDDVMRIDFDCSGASDDIEMFRPLSERIGLASKFPEALSEGGHGFKSISSPQMSSSSKALTVNGREGGQSLTPAQKAGRGGGQSLTPAQKAGRGGGQSLTPAQKAGREGGQSLTPAQKAGREGGQSLTPAQKAGRAAVNRKRTQNLKPTIDRENKTEADVVCAIRVSSSKENEIPSQKTVPSSSKSNSRGISSPSALVVDLTDSSHSTDVKNNLPPFKDTQYIRISPPVDKGSIASKPVGMGTAEASLEGVELGNPEFVLNPGDFEVILCVDSAESTASRKHTSQFRGLLLQELAKNGVLFDVRKLTVGDFLWVGRERVCPVPGQLSLPSSREVVLEYIVERKRMDDLAGSITDGRFREQKFRLRSCGLSRPVYLVEEYQDMTHLQLPLRSLNQSIANTQVIDGFYIKRTKDIRESIAYLTIMTRQLQKHYADKTLKAYPHETISELIITKQQQSLGSIVYSMPFKAFNEASIKNKVLSVYEMFGRQLMQLPSFSADKAVAVLGHYPTVASLRQAYRDCANTGERVKLLSNIKAGKTKRRLGDSLSSLVYSLYWLGKDT